MKHFVVIILIFTFFAASAQKYAVEPIIKKQPAQALLKKADASTTVIAEAKHGNPNIPMILVKGGSFDMGSNDSDDNAKPVHKITLSSFYIGKYEVTEAQWHTVMGSDLLCFKNCGNCPVGSLSWDETQLFITKLNQITGKAYRLPTEAEWEYAARGGSKSNGYTYSGSNNIDDVAWYDGNNGSDLHPVGQKAANELGIFDMTGSLREWCQDWYAADYYATSPSFNPKGPLTGTQRIMRGGGWASKAADCSVTHRDYALPRRSLIRCFRLALTL